MTYRTLRTVATSLMVLAAIAVPTHAQTSDPAINAAVTACVEHVHKMTPSSPYFADAYRQFDAFYNPASGEVENNAALRDPLYEFNKCMTLHGVPLSYPRK